MIDIRRFSIPGAMYTVFMLLLLSTLLTRLARMIYLMVSALRSRINTNGGNGAKIV